MGLDMELMYMQKINLNGWNFADIYARNIAYTRCQKFFFPTVEKLFNDVYATLLPKIVEYYKAETLRPGSGELPMTNPDINEMLSGKGMTIHAVYEVYEYESYAEFVQGEKNKFNEVIQLRNEYKAYKNEIESLGNLNGAIIHKWRKAPAIHQFFIDSVRINSHYHYHWAGFSTIEKLKKWSQDIMMNKENIEYLEENYQFAEGPFYGDYEFNEYFFETIESTLNAIKTFEDKSIDSNRFDIFYSYSA